MSHSLLSDRTLYDANWIKAGCLDSQYDPGTNVDSSVWTFTTCYAIAAVGITLSILLLAMSSTAPAPSVIPTNTSLTSSAAARRRVHREEKKKFQRQEKEQPDRQHDSQKASSVGQQSVPHHHFTCEPYADEPSSKSWQSFEESLISVYIEDGTVSTNPKGSDKEAMTNPKDSDAVDGVIVAPVPDGDAVQMFPATPSTAESENSTLTTEQRTVLHPNKNDDYYMTVLVCYFVFQSISYLVAGFGHMTGQDFTGKTPSRVVHGTAAFAASSLFAASVSEYWRLLCPAKENNNGNATTSNYDQSGEPGADSKSGNSNATTSKTIIWTAAWMLCSLPAVVVFVILDSDLYTNIFLGASHFAVLLTAVFRVCFSDQRHLLPFYVVDAVAMLTYITGLSIQIYLERPCGYEGYKDNCFAECPLPIVSSPETPNHNAIFHMCVLTSLILFGCSKMVQMKHSDRDTPQPAQQASPIAAVSSHHELDVTPSRGRTSGAAAAVLMQDQTIEV